jgi:hypothetical protein
MIKLKKLLSEWSKQNTGPKRWFKPYGDKYTEFEKATNHTNKEPIKEAEMNEGPMNDPALKSLRIKSKGEYFPKISQWWEYDPDDVMRFIYWMKGQMAPIEKDVREKEWANIVKQLHVKYPIPADAEGMIDPEEY